jgi:uncharacterized protein YjlB
MTLMVERAAGRASKLRQKRLLLSLSFLFIQIANMFIKPLSDHKVTKRLIPAWGRIPNTSLQSKPLLIYHSAFEGGSQSDISRHLEKVGAVKPQWTYSMYPTSHYHSTTHEVLSVVAGKAKLCFGHEDNPERFEPMVSKGDVMVVPAGVSHRLLEDVDGGFTMVGAYPPGKEWDMCYGKAVEEDRAENIKKLGWFSKDPIYGESGPALEV